MNLSRTLAPLSFLLAAAILAGCANPLSGGAPNAASGQAAPAPRPPEPAADQAALGEGIDLYNNGDFNGAIKRLGAPDIFSGGARASQLAALKYMAFSYCVTARQTLCRQQFEKALKLDPAFDLAPGEHGHPLWGPVFLRAKKAK